MSDELKEAIIIGGGPAGLTAGIYLQRAGIRSLLLEQQVTGGAALNTEHIENYPGFPEGISGRDLMSRMAEQAKRLDLDMKEFSQVESIMREDGQFVVRVDQDIYRSNGIIVATGTEPTKLGIPGEQEFLGRGISYCATCDGMFFRGLEVAVIGGGDAALSEALSLSNIVEKVYLIHRREEFRAQKILQERAKNNKKIEFLLNKAPLEINGANEVESIRLKDVQSGNESVLPVAGVFFYVGSRPSTAFLGDLVERDQTGFVIAKDDMSTKTAGLFVAGDVRVKTLRQIATAVGDGALAAISMEHFILEKR